MRDRERTRDTAGEPERIGQILAYTAQRSSMHGRLSDPQRVQ